METLECLGIGVRVKQNRCKVGKDSETEWPSPLREKRGSGERLSLGFLYERQVTTTPAPVTEETEVVTSRPMSLCWGPTTPVGRFTSTPETATHGPSVTLLPPTSAHPDTTTLLPDPRDPTWISYPVVLRVEGLISLWDVEVRPRTGTRVGDTPREWSQKTRRCRDPTERLWDHGTNLLQKGHQVNGADSVHPERILRFFLSLSLYYFLPLSYSPQ